jgi:hypothetical protein
MKKKKQKKRSCSCFLCAPHRWGGNSSLRRTPKENAKLKAANKEMKEK